MDDRLQRLTGLMSRVHPRSGVLAAHDDAEARLALEHGIPVVHANPEDLDDDEMFGRIWQRQWSGPNRMFGYHRHTRQPMEIPRHPLIPYLPIPTSDEHPYEPIYSWEEAGSPQQALKLFSDFMRSGLQNELDAGSPWLGGRKPEWRLVPRRE